MGTSQSIPACAARSCSAVPEFSNREQTPVTISIAARCARSGQLGAIIASSSICVASRCAFVRAGAGAALSQNVTDPRLGPRMLDMLEAGVPAAEAVAAAAASTEHAEHRQLALIDAQGRSAHRSGSEALGVHAAASGVDCVSAGNLLDNGGVPAAMVGAFEASSGLLAERLIGAMAAAIDAGGEAGSLHSLGLLVAGDGADGVDWPVIDLRIDWSDRPLAAMRELWREYAPQQNAYLTRALDPNAAPSYGVPGDP